MADQLLAVASTALSGVGSASFSGIATVDISPSGITKATGVAKVCLDTDCPPQETVAFGDMPSDLPLFEWARWACAVANAHPLVLEAADQIVPSNDEDGVAVTIHELLGS
jgi:hydroxymethylpyrimidine pyrophosphatase-like HAD family hydrolase